jgi:hypothetical protein
VLLIAIVIFALSASGAVVTFVLAIVLFATLLSTLLPNWTFWFVIGVPSLLVFVTIAVPLLNNLFGWIEANATASNP